mgnify:CR=1 FL=1
MRSPVTGIATLIHPAGRRTTPVRHHALPHQPPQGDQKLARQGHDHGLASATGGLGAGSKPLRQGALLLEHEKSPRQLDHAVYFGRTSAVRVSPPGGRYQFLRGCQFAGW